MQPHNNFDSRSEEHTFWSHLLNQFLHVRLFVLLNCSQHNLLAHLVLVHLSASVQQIQNNRKHTSTGNYKYYTCNSIRIHNLFVLIV